MLQNIRKGKTSQPPRLLIYGSEGIGKAQPLDACVLTPRGFIPMGNIKVGDLVIGADGYSHKVLGVYPRGERDVYKVTFRDGSATKCCDDHLWFTQTRRERDMGIAGAVRTLRDIRRTLRYGTHFNHQVPRVAPVHYEPLTEELPIAPWLLGMYLGDGNDGNNVNITNRESDIRAKISDTLSEEDEATEVFYRNDFKGCRIKRRIKNNEPSEFKCAITNLGLGYCHSHEKFIPHQYLVASVEERIELLQGLLDSDGFVTQPGSIEYCTTSVRLVTDVTTLIRSLGGSVKVTTKTPKYTYKSETREGRKAWRIFASFPSGIVPVSSEKHLAKWRSPEWAIRHTIRSVEYVARQQCQCIVIDALDSLYVTDDFIVTHNSTFGASAPSPIFLPTEDGLDQIDCESFPLSKTFDEFIGYLTALSAEEHSYRSVVIDSIDWLERLIWSHACKSYGVKSIEKIEGGFGKGYVIVLSYWQQVIDLLRKLRDERGMIVILLAHAKVENFADPESTPVTRFSPRIHKAAAALVSEWVDAVLLATRELGASRGSKGGDRILRTVGSPSCVAKNRYALPEILPFEWDALKMAMTESLKN